MANFATTKMSSRGQIVIPEDVRESLHLKEGSQFVVFGQGDTVILKSIKPPSMEAFHGLITNIRKQVKKAGIKKSDLAAAIKKVRRSSK